MSSTQRRRFRQAPNFDERLIAGTAFEFEVLGSALTRGTTVSNDDNDKRLNDRRFRASFGCSSKQCAIAWILVCDGWHDRPIGATKMRFLWALLLLKSYDTENNMAGTCHCDEKTFRKWAWFFILELSDRSGEVIIWENRYVDDIGNDCLASVDGTDFALAWGASDKRLSCYKFYGKPGLRYEVALCLRTGDIVWTSGPHTPGTVNDLQIFRFGSKYQLGYGERIEADDGYIGECPTYCKCPNGPDHLKDRELMNRLHRSRHETVNQRFKMFGCMKKHFRHDVKKHGQCFECVVLLTQLSINEGPGLFHIEYDDLLDDFTANLIFG